MDNSMDSMLEVYLFEANTLLEQLDDILINSEKEGTFTQESINEIFRIMHTIKGSSAMMQFDSLMTASHRVEDLFYVVREKGISKEYQSELFDIMFACNDFLMGEINKLENNAPLTNDIGSLVQDISNLLTKISQDNANIIGTNQENSNSIITENKADAQLNKENNQSFLVKVNFIDGCQMENIRAFMLVRLISTTCPNITYIPSKLENNQNAAPEIIKNGFVIKFASQDEYENCKSIIENFNYTKDCSIIENKATINEVKQDEINEQKNSENTQVETNKAPQAVNHAKQSLITVNLSKLDALMDLVGEIVIAESMIDSIIPDSSVDNELFSKATRQLNKLTDELQEIVTSIRMVPISGVFQKMNRIVRDMSKKLDKEVNLKIIGEETEVDKTIIDNISDPIMHLVRNSMDHGIEDATARQLTKKDKVGTVTLSAENTGGEILITVADDGKGVDPEKILAKASKNGLLTKPESEYTKKEILSLLLMPGFSTKENVTEFSGRGVGMDVVCKNIEKIGGELKIESDLGKGSTMIIKIPLTLAIVKGMKICVNNTLFNIPINNIIESFKATKSNIVLNSNKEEIIMIRNNYYPVIRLHNHFNIDTDITDLTEGICILVEYSEKTYCLFCDKLIGEQRVVVKPLPTYLEQFNIQDKGISGCAILGDGSICYILDMQSLGGNL